MPRTNNLPNYNTNPYSALDGSFGPPVNNYTNQGYGGQNNAYGANTYQPTYTPWNAPQVQSPSDFFNNNSGPFSLGGIDAKGWTGIVGGFSDLYGAYQKGVQNDNYSKDIAQKQAQWKLNYDRQRDTYNNWANVKNQQSTYTKYNTI